MSNSNAPFGLRRVRGITGSQTAVNEYAHDSGDGTALFIGDPVKNTGTSTAATVANTPAGTPLVIATGTITTTAIRGIVEGIRPTYTNLTLNYGPASTSYPLLVCDDPSAVYHVQSNGTMVAGDIGCTAGVTSGSGSTTTGLSAYVLTESDVGQSSHLLHIIRLAPVQGNALGSYAILEVRINLSEMGATATGT